MKVVVLERNSVGEDIDITPLGQFGELVCYPVTDATTVAERTKDADIVVVNKAPISKEVLEGAPSLKMVAEFATGFDNIDIAACKEKGVAVANVSGYSTDSVAQHTIAMALSLIEQLSWYDDYVKSGTYASQPRFSNFDKAYDELSSLTWGIIGMGAIGKRVAGIAKAFGCKVIFHSVTGKSTVTEYEQVSFDEMLAQSDILSLHCPLSDLTRHMMNARLPLSDLQQPVFETLLPSGPQQTFRRPQHEVLPMAPPTYGGHADGMCRPCVGTGRRTAEGRHTPLPPPVPQPN